MAGKRTAARLHLLTVKQVQAAGEGDHSDGGGLLLRIRGESCSWVFRFTAPTGRRREMGLGIARRGSAQQAGDSLTGARRRAHEARDLLLRRVDPIEDRDRRRTAAQQAEQARKEAAAREGLTLARAARAYHERVIEPKLSAKHSAQWISTLENHLPASVWHQPIADITPPELLAALTAIRPHERARNFSDAMPLETISRIRQRLDAVFEDAMFHERCASNPAKAIVRKLREQLPEQKQREFKALPYKQAPALMHRLRAMPGTAARCLEFAVLTASRTAEALLAEWREFEPDEGIWTVPGERMKAGEPHTVFLPPRAVEILRAQIGQDAAYVFPTPMPGREGKPMSNMALLAVLDRLGARDQTTVHGLCRATFSTWANETGAARPDVIEACLAHEESNRVRAAYNRAQFNEERRALLEAWAAFLKGADIVALGTVSARAG